ncbi:TonB-dependent receptor [Actimicrobium sp. CCC2.4]|uniref:TonB-dependent receptor n=1 Tax=Actimicrobium sp. CCC2.4 TaxID=3048606 RepID=UPI002AC92209|nr:TonB-dependent receptor [Actimicrobium sp. CCC2.4]MEB0134319.1 TonB-dependent receptor [Actimicrobium sp. CCC2.4]WPX32962.1 TonB-dependent receptor [Actimicrobium sp. CCC2.4]
MQLTPLALLASAICAPAVFAQTLSQAPTRSLGTVTVTSPQPSSLPSQIPTTMEGITGQQIEITVNATDSEDALKYFPSLLVRKRYIGDYNHAVLSSRASGTGNSARSAVYADGILLSNYLGNGATYAPRWGLVTPEEIDRADVMYGPFSAAYPGNSVGAVVDYVTRMPKQFEAHVKAAYFSQPLDLYSTNATYNGYQTSASLGNKSGDWSWWLNVNRTDSHGQPLTFPTRAISTSAPAANAVAVTGAVPGLDRTGTPWLLLGTATGYHTIQDHAKVKLAYDLSPTLRASYTLGYWQNSSEGRPDSYLRNIATGAVVTSGPVSINGKGYALTPTDFNLSNEAIEHVMHGLSVKSNTRGTWDWEAAASLVSYQKDQLRAATVALPAALSGGAGTIQDQDGTGWNTLALKGSWRPAGIGGAHIVDFGYQQENYKLHVLKSNIAGDWRNDAAGSLNNEVGGKAQLRSLYAQDRWALTPQWQAVLGLRAENWTASDGFTRYSATSTANTRYGNRTENFFSPKAALSYRWSDDTVLKASTGRAVRMPTVAELYGATATTNSTYINDPNLKPEKSWTSELTAEKELASGLLRMTFFTENVHDALYAQTTFDAAANSNISRVQNVTRMQTNGVELAVSGVDVALRGLDLSGSVTYADSRIKENSGFVRVAGDTIGKVQPRVPVWRATALASYRIDPKWTATLGARYSGKQFSTLNNEDTNGFAYQGSSKYFTTDLRMRYQLAKHWTASFGIDNLNNTQYWNFHPYPQRSYSAELAFNL